MEREGNRNRGYSRVVAWGKENIRSGYTRLVVWGLSRLFPVEYCGSKEIDSQVRDLLAEHKGLLIEPSHPSEGDFRTGMGLLTAFPEIAHLEKGAPIAWHQYNIRNRLVLGVLGTKLWPVVTPHTTEIAKQDEKPVKMPENPMEMWKDYINKATSSLENGGIVVLYPQVRREPRLVNSGIRPNRPIFKYMKDVLDRFAVWPIGIEIEGDPHFNKGDGINPGRLYRLRPHVPILAKDIFDEAGGDFRKVDRVIWEKLNDVAPETYRAKK